VGPSVGADGSEKRKKNNCPSRDSNLFRKKQIVIKYRRREETKKLLITSLLAVSA
jgi:hypothetical protein